MGPARSWAGVAALLASFACLASPVHAEVVQVHIDKMSFVPAQVSAHVGDTIEWVNQDFVAHTATARNKDWDVVIAPGKTARIVVEKAGTVDFYCRFHPNMTGRVEIAGR